MFEVSPDDFAAHHYLIHTYEGLGRIDDALVHGAAYSRLAPEVPHAHHMYGHDLRRVGRVDEAIAVFLKTYELEKAYYAAENIPAGLDWHHGHNLDLLVDGLPAPGAHAAGGAAHARVARAAGPGATTASST